MQHKSQQEGWQVSEKMITGKSEESLWGSIVALSSLSQNRTNTIAWLIVYKP